jgi:hypothetical protein
MISQSIEQIQAERSMTLNSIRSITSKLEARHLNDRLKKLLTKHLDNHKRVLAQLNLMLKTAVIESVRNRQITISRAKLRRLSYLTQQLRTQES